MAEEDVVYLERPSHDEEPASVSSAHEEMPAPATLTEGSEGVWVCEYVLQEITQLEGDPGNGMLRRGGNFESAGEQAGNSSYEAANVESDSRTAGNDSKLKQANEKEIAVGDKAKGKKAKKIIHSVEGKQRTRPYSLDRSRKRATKINPDEFGKTLLFSQWSLRHRIEACKVLQDPSNHWIMSPLSRHAYAQQSLALIRKELKDVCEESTVPSFEDCSRRGLTMEKLQEKVEKLVYQEWKQLTEDLEVELERLRGENKEKEWFLQAGDLYIAVEEGNENHFREQMRKRGEHWASIKPQEYRGATPWHWAVLHNHRWTDFPERWLWVQVLDDFGFGLTHMAIFASSRLPYLEKDSDSIGILTSILICVNNLGQLITLNFGEDDWASNKEDGAHHQQKQGDHQKGEVDGSCSRPASNFLIFKLASSPKSRSCFVAKQIFNSPIHFLHLAIWIGHPRVIKELIETLSLRSMLSSRVNNNISNIRTKCGDTILHLAAWSIDPDIQFDYGARQRVMAILLRNLHHYPTLLNSTNEAGQSPIHIAAFMGSVECVEALLKCPYIKAEVANKNGFSPLQIATKLELKDGKKERMYAKILGGKCVDDEYLGLPTLKYDDVGINPISRKNYGKIISLLGNMEPEILRQWRLLQSSQWSLRHRILALQMFYEDDAKLENIKDKYTEQCLKLPGNQSTEGTVEMENIAKKLRQQLQRLEGEDLCKGAPGKIYTAIEENDVDEFKRLMEEFTRGRPMSLEQYGGATPLHWAALYSRVNMVNKSNYNKVHRLEAWSAIVNAQDKFGFTPLHLAVLSSPIRLVYRTKDEFKMDLEVQNSVKLIHNLYEMGVPHLASNSSQSEFLVWKLTPESIDVDDYLSNSILHPIYLGVHFAHPRIIEKLLEISQGQDFEKNIMWTGDSILHCAETWEGLIKWCNVDEWRKIESVLLMHLDNVPKAVNSCNFNRDTPLHIAVRTKSAKWMEVLLHCEHMKFNLRNREKHTPEELAAKMLESSSAEDKVHIQEIINLIDCFDPESWPRQREEKERALEAEQKKEKEDREEREKVLVVERKKEKDLKQKAKDEKEQEEKQLEQERKDTEALQRDRQVYVDAANAILVGAALIASASFGAWLQPPLGFHPYYSPEFLVTDAPPPVGPVYESFVPIQQYWTIHMFWIFNSLSFFFSLATVIAGADAALPQQVATNQTSLKKAEAALTSVKKSVKRAAWLLVFAIVFAICTFATLGFIVLPPITKYRINMMVSLGVGGLLCVWFLIKLGKKLVSKDRGATP